MRYLITPVLFLIAINADAQTKADTAKHSAKVDYAELNGIDAAVVPSSGKASSHIVT